MNIRFAKREDARALLEIYRQYINTTVTFEEELPTPAEFEGRISEISEKYPYLVAQEGGRILGYAYAHEFGERSALRFAAELTVYVDQNCRGKGLGKVLYRCLLALLTLQGVRYFSARVTSENRESMDFHRKLGFKEAGMLEKIAYKNGSWVGLCYLEKRITEDHGIPAFVPLHCLPGELLDSTLQNSRQQSEQ